MQGISKLIAALKNGQFFKDNAVFWSASLFVSFLNYLYYPVLGRLLDPVPFGETQTIISFFTQAAAFFQVLGLVSVGIITKYEDEETKNRLTSELSRAALLISLIAFAATVIFSSQLKNFFHFGSVVPFILLGITLLVNVPASFANSYLQGNKKFKSLARVSILGAICKLILSVIFVLVGLQAAGAIGGLLCAQIISLLFSLSKGRGVRNFVQSNLHGRRLQLDVLKPELPYAGVVLLTSLTTNLLLSFDILVVKHYFSPQQAGLYTGISIISNIIFFITGPFAAVMIASVRLKQTKAENFQTLKRSLTLTTGIGGAVLVVFLAIPHIVVTILLGHTYSLYADYLRGLGLALFVMSVANLLIYYHIGLRHFLVAPAVLGGLITTLVLLASQHATMGHVVLDLVTGAVVLLGLLLGLFPYYQKEHPA